MSCPQPLYTTFDSVKVRLTNKVQFQADPDTLQNGELPNALLAQCISDAETKVELDLNGRYAIPFQSKRTGRYCDLPDHTKRSIRTVVDARSVMEILRTDFGRGTHINGEKYYEGVEKEYKKNIDVLLGRNAEAANEKHDRYRFSPPLPDLLLALSNREADYGYKGMIINSDASRTDAVTYAEEQVNNPAATYVNRRINNGAGGGGFP